jgi:hypothetical protein
VGYLSVLVAIVLNLNSQAAAFSLNVKRQPPIPRMRFQLVWTPRVHLIDTAQAYRQLTLAFGYFAREL